MNTVEQIKEDIDVGVEQVSLNIPVRVTMFSVNNQPFEFKASIDDIGQIILTPVSKDVEFISAVTQDDIKDDILLSQQEDVMIEKSEDSVEKSMSINVGATMLVEEETTTKVSTSIDEIGQCVIYPLSKENSFITASIEDSLNLVTEETEKEEETKEEKIPKNVDASVISEEIEIRNEMEFTEAELEKALSQLTSKFTELEGGIYCDTVSEQKACEKILKKYYKDVSIGVEYDRLTVFYSKENTYLKEDIDDESLMNILIRFLQGDISLITDAESEPKESFIHLKDVDKDNYEYYYDPDSDSIGVYKR